jgi:adenosine deaminase
MDRAGLEYPVKPGLIFCLDRAFRSVNEIIVEKAIAWRDRGVVSVDIAAGERPSTSPITATSTSGPASTGSG